MLQCLPRFLLYTATGEDKYYYITFLSECNNDILPNGKESPCKQELLHNVRIQLITTNDILNEHLAQNRWVFLVSYADKM